MDSRLLGNWEGNPALLGGYVVECRDLVGEALRPQEDIKCLP